MNATAPKDVVELGIPTQTALVPAVTAAVFVPAVKGEGPLTVFAPAKAALPAGTVDGLVKPENKGALTNILSDHVVSGAVKAG
jgi:uncharacterized surface protein with fasciclin (FAS1) repeats